MFTFFKKKNLGEKIVLKIEGMHCTSCAMNIDGALEEIDGVYSAETSYARSQVTVSFNPAKVSIKKIRAAIESEGYTIS